MLTVTRLLYQIQTMNPTIETFLVIVTSHSCGVALQTATAELLAARPKPLQPHELHTNAAAPPPTTLARCDHVIVCTGKNDFAFGVAELIRQNTMAAAADLERRFASFSAATASVTKASHDPGSYAAAVAVVAPSPLFSPCALALIASGCSAALAPAFAFAFAFASASASAFASASASALAAASASAAACFAAAASAAFSSH